MKTNQNDGLSATRSRTGRRIAIGLGLVLIVVAALLTGGCAYTSAGAEIGTEQYTGPLDYPVLDPYGEWAYIYPYGRCWRPWVVDGWQPFFYGDWVYSQDGWTWNSYEPFGWVVYHYGDWDYDTGIGWFWIPGNSWSPARVVWANYGDYVCWAPIRPGGREWGRPWEDRDRQAWTVVEGKDFTREDVGHFRVESSRMIQSAPDMRTRVINRPPDQQWIQDRAQTRVEPQKFAREKVAVGHRQLRKNEMTGEARQRIDRNRPVIEREVLRSRQLAPVPERLSQPEARRTERGQQESRSSIPDRHSSSSRKRK